MGRLRGERGLRVEMASGELMASERVEEEEEVDVGGDFIISRSKAYVLPKHDELISRQ